MLITETNLVVHGGCLSTTIYYYYVCWFWLTCH